MKKLNIEEIEVSFDGLGEYGVHDGFFNAIAIIDNTEYDFQCCTTEDGTVDFYDNGFDCGICSDANEKIAEKIEWENVNELLKKAYKQWL